VELVEITTQGDVDRKRSIEEIGTLGVFTKEIQRALLAGDVDLGVHSLKDLPTDPVEGLMLAAVPKRESPADALISRDRLRLDQLRQGARVGTGSLRRQAQLRHLRPDLRVIDIRGNVDTRLRKLEEENFDAIVLAEAGLKRLGLARRISHLLPFDVLLPAVGQGALAIECRTDAAETIAALKQLEDSSARAAITAERSLLAHLSGGCLAPIGAWGRIEGDALWLSAVVLSANGEQRLAADDSAPPHEASSLGQRVADVLLGRGAAELIRQSRQG
jgi:hydroxymethylbilane synthase